MGIQGISFFGGGVTENFYKSEDALKQVAAPKYYNDLSKHTFHVKIFTIVYLFVCVLQVCQAIVCGKSVF